MPGRENVPYAADFETTTELNLEIDGYVRVWCWSIVDSKTMKEWYGSNIEEFFKTCFELQVDVVYFHNLKFDGRFIINYLCFNNYVYGVDYKCLIDDMNNWYEIWLSNGEHEFKIWDSLKKFPGCSVNSIAKMYKIEGKKEQPFFDIYRPEDYEPTKEEIEYCLQDSRIIAYAIGQQYKLKHKKMTLSSDAFSDVKKTIGYFKYNRVFPELSADDDERIRKAYKGGWTYLNPIYQEKDIENVQVYD